MNNEPKLDAFSIVTPTQAKTMEPNLPPAGFQRDEVLAERSDNLAQAAEQQPVERERIPADHDALRPERNREIQHDIARSYLDIGLNHPIYITKWVNYVNLQGQMVWSAKADGWLIATPNEFPEAKDLARVDNTIRVGDVLLMFITKDKHLQLVQRDDEKRRRQQFGLEADIHMLAAQHPEAFGRVHTPELGGDLSHIMTQLDAQSQRREALRKVAAHSIGNQMKRGVIPGVPIK